MIARQPTLGGTGLVGSLFLSAPCVLSTISFQNRGMGVAVVGVAAVGVVAACSEHATVDAVAAVWVAAKEVIRRWSFVLASVAKVIAL